MPAADPADVAGPHEQPVAVDLGVGRVVTQRAQEQRATSAWAPRLPTAAHADRSIGRRSTIEWTDIERDSIRAGRKYS